MPLYSYRAIDPQGKKRSGIVEALSEGLAKQQLRAQGIMVSQLTMQTRSSSRQSLKGNSLLAFSLQLSQLLNAGVPLYESLQAIEEQARGEPYHRVILSLCEKIKGGSSLSQAMRTFPDSFDNLYCSLVAAGEAVGEIGPSLEKIAQLLRKQNQLKKQISNALIYPALLTGFAFVVVGVLLGFVIPSIEGIFEGQELNRFTRCIIALSHGFRSWAWLAIPLVVAAIAYGISRLRTEKGKLWWQKNVLRVPLLKTLVIQSAVIRFCRTLSTLQQGGLPMIDSLRIARAVMNNVLMAEEMEAAEKKIIEGNPLSAQLLASRYFPPLVGRMAAVGEEAGSTVAIMQKVADMVEEEWQKTVDRLMALFQPVLLLIMGGLIVIVLLAILLPLTDVSSFTLG